MTAENDPNQFLRRPHQYTSKITFTDGRITDERIEGYTPGSVELGGSIEAFPTQPTPRSVTTAS
ncbi:hypothetical protein [Streptomyces sp. NPDC001903]|uniref:hypothetical protein n=1 Tax=Streptomyces sp. NPDC001903 TaxID=3364622 RepID=UPI0036A9C7AA